MGRSEGRRVWFYRPELYWFGWRTLLPVSPGADEYGRYTLVFGWNFTGQMVVAVCTCYCDECRIVRYETAQLDAEE